MATQSNGAAEDVTAEGKEDMAESKYDRGADAKDDVLVEEDDGMSFEIMNMESEALSPSKAPPVGIGLDLSLANVARDQRQSLRCSAKIVTTG